MPRLIVVVFTAAYVTLLCSHPTWAFSQPNKHSNHQPGRCRKVPGIGDGAVDIQVLPNGLAFIISGLAANVRGNVLLFDFKKRTDGAQVLDIVGDLDIAGFAPHCLSIWRDTNRNLVYIFVTSTPANDINTVEKFRFDEKTRTLYHVRTYKDPTITHLVDIVATGEDTFYYINFFEFNFILEVIFGIRVGNVGYYDGTSGRILLTKLATPIGINVSPNGKYIYVSEYGRRRVTVYKRKSDNSLRLRQVVPFCSMIDLIDVDVATGDLWVGAHPDTYLILKYFTPPHTSISPSQVFRLKVCDGGASVCHVEEVYYNDGQQIPGASVAVHYGRHMLIGSLFDNMLLCQVRKL